MLLLILWDWTRFYSFLTIFWVFLCNDDSFPWMSANNLCMTLLGNKLSTLEKITMKSSMWILVFWLSASMTQFFSKSKTLLNFLMHLKRFSLRLYYIPMKLREFVLKFKLLILRFNMKLPSTMKMSYTAYWYSLSNCSIAYLTTLRPLFNKLFWAPEWT